MYTVRLKKRLHRLQEGGGGEGEMRDVQRLCWRESMAGRQADRQGSRQTNRQAGPGSTAQRSAASPLPHAPRLPAVEQLGAGLEDRSEEVAVAVLILAPVLKVLKQGVQLVVGVALQVPAGRQE